jgi:hypothetical protein
MREYQLADMQRQTGAPVQLAPTQMPSTFADLNFTERMDALREGWQDPAVNKYPTYNQLNVEKDVTMYGRQGDEAEARATTLTNKGNEEINRQDLLKKTDIEAWCRDYPDKCFADDAYNKYLKETDYGRWASIYREEAKAEEAAEERKGKMEDARNALVEKYKDNPTGLDDALKLHCIEYPEDTICLGVAEERRRKEAEAERDRRAAEAQAERDKARDAQGGGNGGTAKPGDDNPATSEIKEFIENFFEELTLEQKK